MPTPERALGPGAKGDLDNPGLKEDPSEATATEVVEKVESGEVTRDEALAAEESRDKPRKTVISKLDKPSEE